jgi:hypothetical protein
MGSLCRGTSIEVFVLHRELASSRAQALGIGISSMYAPLSDRKPLRPDIGGDGSFDPGRKPPGQLGLGAQPLFEIPVGSLHEWGRPALTGLVSEVVLDAVEVAGARVFHRHHSVGRAVTDTNELVQFQLCRAGVMVLGVLKQHDHQQGDDRESDGDNQFPPPGEARRRADDEPDAAGDRYDGDGTPRPSELTQASGRSLEPCRATSGWGRGVTVPIRPMPAPAGSRFAARHRRAVPLMELGHPRLGTRRYVIRSPAIPRCRSVALADRSCIGRRIPLLDAQSSASG